MLSAQWIRLTVQLAGIVVLSNLLAPSDFGLVAMVSVVVGLAAVLGDFGLSLSALASGELEDDEKSWLFWLNCGIGSILAIAILLIAPLISNYFGDDRIVEIARWLAIPFLTNAVSVQFKVELNLSHAWVRLALVETAPQIVGLGVAVALAMNGAGYVTLVVQIISVSALQLVAAVILTAWRPTVPRSRPALGEHLSFGRDTAFLQVANYISANADSVLIGRALGSTSLGLYNRAFQLTAMPTAQIASPLTRVVLPRLSAASRTERERLMGYYQRMLSYALLAPLSLLAGCAGSLLPVALGPAWSESVTATQILAIGAAAQAMGYVYYWGFLANRKTASLAKRELLGRILMIVAMALTVREGILAVATCYVLGQGLILCITAFGARKALGVSLRQIVAPAIRPLALFLSLALATHFLTTWIDTDGLRSALLSLAVWLTLATSGCYLITPVKRDLRAAFQDLRRPPTAAA